MLSDLFVWLIPATLFLVVWQHHNVRRLAYATALRHTEQQSVTLLDQSIVLKKLRIARSNRSLFALKREFGFEFSSLGDTRYQGRVVFVGRTLIELHLDPFKVEPQYEPIE